MKFLTKNTDYAIRALVELGADRGRYHSAREISRKQGIPYHYLRRILQVLMREKIIESKEGGAGGVRLVKPPASIRLLDIIEAFQGTVQLSQCTFRGKACPRRKTCSLRRHILRIERTVMRQFRALTVKILCAAQVAT